MFSLSWQRLQMLNQGDLVQVKSDKYCKYEGDVFSGGCFCFFCVNDSLNAVGLVTTVWIDEDDNQSAIIEFACGESVFREPDYTTLEVLSRV